MTEEQQKILAKMADRLETLVEYKIERHPDDYYIRTTTGGFGYEGCAKNEDIYDESRAHEDVIEDIYDWAEDDQMMELVKQLLWTF